MAGFSQLNESLAQYTFQVFNDADAAGTWKAVGAIFNGMPRYDTCQVVNTDMIPHNVKIGYSPDDSQLMAELLIPARTGCDGSSPMDVLAVIKPAAFHYFAFNTFTMSDIQLQLVEVLGAGRVIVFMLEGGLP